LKGAGWNPVIAVPGLTPKSPLRIDSSALVTVVAANTANVDALPRGTASKVIDLRRAASEFVRSVNCSSLLQLVKTTIAITAMVEINLLVLMIFLNLIYKSIIRIKMNLLY